MKDTNFLILDEEFAPIITKEECEELKPIVKKFIQCYIKNKDNPVMEWLPNQLQEELPDRKSEEIQAIADEIVSSIKITEEKTNSLNDAIKNGRSKESWFTSEMKQATSAMSTGEAAKYLNSLDSALSNANNSLLNTITTQNGIINQNPNLDGFIAEQYHAQTFNMNAEATGSQYRAKVLEPTGKGYAKNSVDIEILDGNGKVVKRYQSKYCKNADATLKAFENGDYRGQQKLVPEDQLSDISKKATAVIEAPDGTTSNPLSKPKAQQLRDEAQSGKWNELNWNEYAAKDLAIGIGKQAGYSALQGAAIGVGFNIAKKLWDGEEIDGGEVVETALQSGVDFGVKTATAGALKVGVEKNIIHFIPKGTPAATIANIAHVAIENIKVAGKVFKGDLTVREGLDKMAQTTVATSAGLVAMAKGGAIGAAAGMVFGPIGATIGGFAGGCVGYMAGSKIGEKIYAGAKKIKDFAVETIKKVGNKIKEGATYVGNKIKNFFGIY